MNLDPDFELSADMRLLELQRASLGLGPPNKTAWQSRATNDAGIGDVPEAVSAPRSAVLAVEATATPNNAVIPGAVITATLSVLNEGAVAARNVVVSVPVPGGSGYRQGSFVADGRPVNDDTADLFLNAGLSVDEIAPGERRTFVWKLGVRLGVGSLLIAPSVRAQGAAVVGARAVAVSRKDQNLSAFASEIERVDPAMYAPKPLIPVEIPADELPFYELDAEEELVYEAADAALSPATVPEIQLVDTPPIAQAEFKAEPAVVEEQPESAPEPVPPPREAVVLYNRFDRATVSFFDATFNGSKEPTLLSHCIFASALACSIDRDGDDSLKLRAHLDAQSQILHRMQLHERLGKKEPITEYAGSLLATLDSLQPAPITGAPSAKDTIFLENELSEPTLGVLAKINEERDRWDFVKARQLTLALQAQRIASLGPRSASGAALENALRIYAQTAMTTLQKIFVRLRLDKTTGVLFQSDAQLDAAARSLIAAFTAAIG